MRKAILLSLLVFSSAVSFTQTSYYVNDNSSTGDVFTSGTGSNSNSGTVSAPFATLQYAITQSSAGDIIYVDAGTYTGQVTIDKGLTIIGAGQSLTFITNTSQLVAPPGPFAEYALIQTTQGIGDVNIRDITATNGTIGDGHTIMIQSGGSVKNCRLLNGGQGIFFRIPDATVKTCLSENNTIEPTGIGINCQGSGLTATIKNNTISKASSFYSGIFAGLDFGPLPKLTIQNNIINNYFGDGMLVASFNGTYTSNSITGTGTFAINRNGNGGNTPIATCNWFGSSNAGTVASKISGTVLYSPFLTSGTDNSSDLGFQPAAACGTGNTYYVNDNSTTGDVFTNTAGNDANAGTATAPFATIQYAVNIAAANDIIYVDAGTYTEQVTITKGLTIIGAGQNATSILKPAVTVAPPGSFPEQGVIQTAQNIGDVNIKDVSVTGDYNVGVTPIIIQSSGSVRNCKLQSGNQGLFVRIDAAINPGAKTFSIEGNTIQAEYIAVNVEGTSLHAILSNNTLAASNAGFSVGIFAGMDFGILNRITATNNLFSNYLSSGIWVNANNASITQNAFVGTGASAINRTGGANVTANCNWYGTANASSIVNKVNTGVNYYPWYIDGTDASSQAGFQHYGELCGAGSNVYYVNDGSTTGDLFTTTIGNDANAGTSPASPLATVNAALTLASPGAAIYVDAGTYSQNITIGKQVQIIGTNYNVSPNSASDPLLLNPVRNAESIIDASTWTIGADGISMTGLTFTPTGNAVILNNAAFGSITINRNRVRINSIFPAFFFLGSGTGTSVSGNVNWGLTISENRFEKEDASSGNSIRVNRFGSVNIYNNSFVVTGSTVRTQNSLAIGNNGVVPYLFINNNTFDRAATAINTNSLGYTTVNNNKFINTSTAFLGNNLFAESSDVSFLNNTLDGSAGIFPFVQYTRQAGDATGASSSFTAEGNTITGTAVAGTTTLLGSMNLIFANSVLNQSLTVRNNKITYNGNLATIEGQFIRPIMMRGNLKNTVVEKNEITLNGSNLQPGNPANLLPVCPAITLYTENGNAAFLQPGSVINVLNNKVSGFKHSFIAFDPGTGNDAYTGFGNIPAGVTVNVNNNSFTVDSISINNGTVGQPVLATCNWYGSADAAIVIPKMSGIPTFSPWLSNGTDNDVATGFQPVPNVCNGRQNKFYVNDALQTGDVFTTAVGNDANSGVPSAPLLTLTAAYNKAQAGDTIYVDAGFYQTSIDITLNKSITILGTNYQISPKDPSNSLQLNSARLPESIVVNHSFIIAANDIRIKGFYFDPASKTQIQQTVTTNDFDNIEIEKNVFSIVSNITSINITGKQITPLVTVNYSINDNRFVKEFGTGGTTISINAIDAVQINNNVFTTNNLYFNNARIQTGIVVGGLTGDIVISNNSAYQQNFFINGISAKKTTISFNSADECNRFAFSSSGNVNPNELEITDNIITNPRSTGGPVISYVRSNGINLSSPNIARIERNTITLNATGLTNVAQALIAPTLDAASANTQVFIRNNKLSITGDFSSLSSPSAYVSAIRYLTNSRYTLVERNEMEFSATNYGASNKFGIGILHSGLQPDASFNFLNNKFSGFPTSIGIQNQATGNYGELPIGLTFSINNNSFTSDGMSINNGVSGQSALANCNWYGSASAQNFINKLSLSTVDIVPWLTNGTDNDVATGFQPVPGSCDGYPTLIVLDSYTNVNCNGAASGTINITTSYGKAPFTYTWTKDGDANFVSHEEDPTGLTAGVYHLTIVDGNGSNIYITDPEADGPGTIDVTITEPSLLTASATGTNNLCNGNTAGTATVTPDGGTAPYTYLWSTNETTAGISNLAAGIYSVTVTDANGCTANSSYEVTEPTLLTATASGTNVDCNGNSTGTASVNANGGTGAYTYLWSNGETTASLSNLSAGIYSVTVTDANGCTASSSYEVTQPSLLTANASGSDVSCFGGSNGTATVLAGGGITVYSYLWSNGATTSSISNLSAGIYSVTVTDANGCTASSSYEVTEPAQLTASAGGTNVSCFNNSNGTASVNAVGGTAPYSYSWSNGSSSQNISNLAAGVYTVTVKDANGCMATSSYEVTQPALPLTANASGTNVSCFNGTNGTASVTVTGGTVPYTYSWSNGSSSQNISNLAAGTYTVTVTDANGCTATSNTSITQPSAIVITIGTITNTCSGAGNGSISSSATGGTGILTYNWTGPNGFSKASKNISNLVAGVYKLTVTDANNCTVTAQATVNALPAITASSVVTDITCYNTSTGAINLTPGGGTGVFSFSWTGPNGFKASTEDISNVKAGAYSVTITDAAGCTAVYSYPVGTPSAAVSLSVQKTDAVCSSGGSLTITGNGGRTPYTYSINGTVFQSSNVFSNLAAGTYNAITIKDNSGCTVVAAVITIVNSDSYEIYSNEKQNVSNLNTTIAFNQAIAARISPTATDKDWYNIKTGAVPGTVTVSLTHPSVAYTFGLYDNKGKIVGVSSSTATTKTYNALLPNAVYSIQISGTVASASCYTLLVTSTAVPVAARVMSQNLQPVITTDKLAAMVYPNPHHGSFGIRIEASQSGTATVEIINITGQRIELRKVAIIKGSNNVVRFSNMRQSALIYKVTMGDEVKTGKIISAN